MTKPRRMTVDLHPDDDTSFVAGDVLFTPRARYVVVEAQPVDSRVWWNRWRLTIRRVDRDPGFVPSLGVRAHHVSSYGRGEGPAEHFGVAAP